MTTEHQLAQNLITQAKEQGLDLSSDTLLKTLTQDIIQAALDEELTDHLGYPKHAENPDETSQNARNGYRTKTLLTDTVGPIDIKVPRDRDGSFEPTIVPKRTRRLKNVDEIILSLAAKGLTYGDIAAHFEQIYGASISKDTISRITSTVLEQMNEWATRPLETVYVAVFIDAIYLKVREGQVSNRPFYVAMGVNAQGYRDVLGIWAGPEGAGESAKFWLQILTELKNRGTADIFYLVCDGLSGLPEAVNAVFERTIVHNCVIHMIRNSMQYAPRGHWEAISRDLKPVYQAVSEQAAQAALEAFGQTWDEKYPAISALWRRRWEEFIPFLSYELEVPRVLYSTNAIESLNARLRRSARSRGHFVSQEAALKFMYLTVRSLDPSGAGARRWMTRWKPALNAFAIVFGDRLPQVAGR
ncbi:transposase [Rothia nasimurium]|uniref:Mutator family transposase n=4 Tax=Rothia TaxID=32207 RepID=A0A1Y1RPL1_9MICC|nr:IS256 family transposase [Rothia nasimurium]ORC17851.1 transposase [Rothia nasimurium]